MPENRLLMKSFPAGVQAIIIHKRYLIDNSLILPNLPENFCLECTILHNGGVEHEMYTLTLFTLGSVSQFIQRSKQNIVISELCTSSSNNMIAASSSYNQPKNMSQQSMMFEHPMSQQEYDPIPPMGFGNGPYMGDM